VAYNSFPNTVVYNGTFAKDDLDKAEVKFQISLKYKLVDNIYRDSWDLFIAYANLSHWQACNSDVSEKGNLALAIKSWYRISDIL
jgi:phospholipase A1